METIAAFAIIVFLLGLFFGLPYKQAYQRRLALLEQEKIDPAVGFLKAALASITSTSTYKEHGLIVITFADVGIATQSELPAGASISTSSYQPPAGVVLLSPFVKAGQRSSTAFDPTSPRQSLEKLLH